MSASSCYYEYDNTILSEPDWFEPCGTADPTSSPVLNCCAVQSNNICLSNSICFDPNKEGGSFYLSPCTDETYSAPECPQYCSMFYMLLFLTISFIRITFCGEFLLTMAHHCQRISTGSTLFTIAKLKSGDAAERKMVVPTALIRLKKAFWHLRPSNYLSCIP